MKPKKRYIRKGHCLMCGVCCEKEGPDGTVCEYLSEPDVLGERVCTIFGKAERPLKCWLFPELPPIPFKNCGFYFVDRYEGGRVIKPGEV